jgi:hypothetical protein
VGKPEGKRSLGRPKCSWVDDITLDLSETGCGVMACIDMVHDTDGWRVLVSMVMNLLVP